MARIALALLAVVLLISPCGFPQEFRSTVSGRITDVQSAVIPGATVVAEQVDTGAKYATISGEDGQYVLPFLAPGGYRLTVELPGFKKYVREGVHVGTNERLALDVTLDIGQLTDTVTVTAAESMLDTTTASTGQVITQRQIENMPIAGRTPLVLAQLAMGVITSTDPRFNRPFDNAGPSGFSMGGAPNRTNELLIDGGPDSTRDSRVAYNPPMDAVSEVKVESFMADAAYGHTGGGTVNIVLKSGTNQLHGALYEFNQVSALAATPFFTNLTGQKKPVSRFNQFGGNVGGPIWIPRLFDGRNKVFFYFGYEGVSDALPDPILTTMPTEAERRGDFSALLAVSPQYQIYDPLTGVREGTRIRRQPFPNNIIPESRISSIAKKYLEFYPLPNRTGLADGQNNLISNTNGERNKFYNYLGRLDFNLSSRHKAFWSFRHNYRRGSGGNNFNNAINSITSTNALERTNWGTTIDDVYSFSSQMVLNTRLHWTRFEEPRRNFSDGFDFTTLGFPASLKAASLRSMIPRVRFDRFSELGDSGPVIFPYDTWQLFASMTRVRGKQTLKFGADLRAARESRFEYGFSSGDYRFQTQWTRGPLDNSPASPGGLGQDLAAFLLGLPTSGSWDVNAARTNQAGYFALFLHDDLRVRPNLTLNLGVRYERDLATTERYNRTVNGFDFTTASPIDAAARAAYARNPIAELLVSQFRAPGGLLFASDSRREVYEPRAGYFSPRFGFAWTPGALHQKTVIRGGVGVFVFPIVTGGINQFGFSQQTSLVASLDGFLTPAATLANPFPTAIEKPTDASLGLATFLGRSVNFFNPKPLNPYAIRWSFGFEQQLGKDLVLEALYMGNHAVHLELNRQLNFVPRQYLATSPVRDQATIDRLTAQVPNPFAGLIPGTGLNSSVISRAQLLRPFPQFTSVRLDNDNAGSSYLHMMQVRLEKRYSAGLQFVINYQLSKLIEQRSFLNESDSRPEKRIAAEDRPQRFVLSMSYDLPFGRGKRLASGTNRFVNAAIGGWIVNALAVFQPGEPLTWGNLLYLGGDLRVDPSNIERAFDTSRFVRDPLQQLDQNIRTFPSRFSNARADGARNVDLSILKNFHFSERIYLQLRGEFFNGMNTPTFRAPDLSPTSSSFGRITGQANQPRRTQIALRLVW
jgi:hypothetical protein